MIHMAIASIDWSEYCLKIISKQNLNRVNICLCFKLW